MEQISMVPVEDLHPHEKNPRIDAASVTGLVESIREHGIEVPLVAAPRPAGDGYVVLGGHRRLTAALVVGLIEVPVQIRADLTDAKAQLAFMATENILRDQLTAVEESRLVQDMLDLGMTQAEVAKQTALGKKRIAERVKLGKLAEQTGDKVHRGQITVDQALVIAEYADDPESADQLEESAGTYNFDWAVSRAKQRREHATMIEDAKKNAKKLGLRLVDEDADFVGLNALLEEVGWTTPALDAAASDDVEDEEWENLVHAEHKSCPGHSARINEYGQYRGSLAVGCDQVATQHADATATTPEAEPEPEPANPWDDLTPEDFETARIHREQHLAKTLPHLDLADEALDIAVKNTLSMGWSDYVDDPHGISLLEAITDAKGKTKVAKALRTFPLSVLVWIGANTYTLRSHHRYMAEGKQGPSYWNDKSELRQLLERTHYTWSEPEQKAILLATGIPHDHTDTEPTAAGAALAEGGDAA